MSENLLYQLRQHIDCVICLKEVSDLIKHAETAEAEVERLTNILRDILKHVGLCHDSSDSNLNSFYTWVDDTLGGGGRESGRLTAGETSASEQCSPARGSRTVAANPTACTCAIIIGRGPCPVHGWSATKPSAPMIYDEGGIVIHKKRVNDSICNICGMSELQVKAHWDDKQPGFHFFKPKEVL